jgi:PST family polysaccharide transporter
MVTSVTAFVIGLPWGATGVAAAYAISDVLIRMPFLWWWVGRSGPVRHRDLLEIIWPFGVALAVTLALLGGVRLWAPYPGLGELVLSAALAFGGFWAMLACTGSGRETLAEATRLLTARFARSPARGNDRNHGRHNEGGSGEPAVEPR